MEVRHIAEARNDAAWKCFGAIVSGDISLWLGKFIEAREYLTLMSLYENDRPSAAPI